MSAVVRRVARTGQVVGRNNIARCDHEGRLRARVNAEELLRVLGVRVEGDRAVRVER